MYFDTTVQAVSTISAAAACSYAVWRGGAPERFAAVAILFNWFASPLIEAPTAYQSAERGIFAIDLVTGAALMAVSLTSGRFWPLWVTGFQILELLMHVAMGVDHHVRPRAYFIGLEIASYLILLALVAGVWFEAPRGRLTGRRAGGDSRLSA